MERQYIGGIIISENAKTAHRDRITWLLIAGLLFLRFPLIFLASMIDKKTAVWAYPAADIGTYLLIALLILWERDRLAQSNIDGLALGILLAKPVESIFYVAWGKMIYLLYIPIGIGLALALLRLRPAVSGPNKKSWRWLAAGILTGMAFGIITGYIFSHFQASGPGWVGKQSFSTILLKPLFLIQYLGFMIINPVQQMFYAGAMEEPLFRGFLWGALRRLGWRNGWICLFQAGIFCLGHIYYIPAKLYWSFGFTFIAALVFGFLAWRSRSIATSMAAHGFVNGWGNIFGNMIKW